MTCFVRRGTDSGHERPGNEEGVQFAEVQEEKEVDPQLPAAWRIDKFLDNYEDEEFSSLAHHRLEFQKERSKGDLMARNHDDDYVVHALSFPF